MHVGEYTCFICNTTAPTSGLIDIDIDVKFEFPTSEAGVMSITHLPLTIAICKDRKACEDRIRKEKIRSELRAKRKAALTALQRQSSAD